MSAASAPAPDPKKGSGSSRPGAEDTKAPARKGFLVNTRLAAVILVAVVLVLTPIGARSSLRRAVSRVERQFYTGVAPYGAIADYLEDTKNAVRGILSVASNYDAVSREAEALRESRIRLEDASGISESFSANADVAAGFDELRQALGRQTLTDADAESLEYYGQLFDGSQGAIRQAGYNEAVYDFNENVYNTFPASLIGSALGVDPAESFG